MCVCGIITHKSEMCAGGDEVGGGGGVLLCGSTLNAAGKERGL